MRKLANKLFTQNYILIKQASPGSVAGRMPIPNLGDEKTLLQRIKSHLGAHKLGYGLGGAGLLGLGSLGYYLKNRNNEE